jgi:hypothetical protein
LSLTDIPPLLLVVLSPPLVVWAWGLALEQLAIGIERFDQLERRRP